MDLVPTFSLDTATGLLRGVRQVLSPHHDARPVGQQPELVVVHGISLPPGEFGGPWIDRLFCGDLPASAHPYFAGLAALRVSAHLLVRRDGSVTQYVPLHARAWHAGASNWQAVCVSLNACFSRRRGSGIKTVSTVGMSLGCIQMASCRACRCLLKSYSRTMEPVFMPGICPCRVRRLLTVPAISGLHGLHAHPRQRGGGRRRRLMAGLLSHDL